MTSWSRLWKIGRTTVENVPEGRPAPALLNPRRRREAAIDPDQRIDRRVVHDPLHLAYEQRVRRNAQRHLRGADKARHRVGQNGQSFVRGNPAACRKALDSLLSAAEDADQVTMPLRQQVDAKTL